MTKLKSIYTERMLLLPWFVADLIIGAAVVQDYGMSIDEPNNQRYAVDTWNAYPSLFGTRFEPAYRSSYEGHGPAFITMAGIFVKGMQRVIPGAFAPDLWHSRISFPSCHAAFASTGEMQPTKPAKCTNHQDC